MQQGIVPELEAPETGKQIQILLKVGHYLGLLTRHCQSWNLLPAILYNSALISSGLGKR